MVLEPHLNRKIEKVAGNKKKILISAGGGGVKYEGPDIRANSEHFETRPHWES